MQAWPPPIAPRAQISRVPYLPGLDGLRALAVIAVIVYHADHGWLGGGFLGVEVFFVISGYLITLLLIGEHEKSSRISLRRFWGRRIRRLLPALFVLLSGLAVYMALFRRAPQGQTRGDFLGGLLYGSNWYQIAVGQGYTAAEAFTPLRHLWSLAVEEQYYLLWPLVMWAILRRGRAHLPKVGLWLAGISAAITVATAVLYVGGDVATTCAPDRMHGYWRIAGRCVNINEALYLGSFTRASGLLLGSAFAMWWRPMALARSPLRAKGPLLDVVGFLGLGGLGLLCWKIYLSVDGRDLGTHYDAWLFRGGLFLTGLCTLALIAAVAHRRALTGRVIGNPVLAWIGARSYGLYLFHWPVFQIIRGQAGVALTPKQFAIGSGVTLVVTELSYRYVETPIRLGRFREWLRGERKAQTQAVYNRRRSWVALSAVAAGLVGFAGVSIATADNVCVGAVECSLESAGAVVPPSPTVARPSGLPAGASGAVTTSTVAATSSAPTTSTVAPAGDDPTEPATTVFDATRAPPSGAQVAGPDPGAQPATTEPTTVPTTSSAAPAGPPVPVGPDLSGGGPPPLAIGESVMQGAAAQLAAGGFAVDADRSRQGTDIALILQQRRAAGQIGLTVVVQAGTNGTIDDATYDQMMASLPEASTPNVYFLTVRAPRGWIDGNNARIAALPSRYPNVKVVDWKGQSEAAGVQLCADEFHIACSAASQQFFANMIFDAVGRPDLKPT